jgi:hypothetical protein
MIVAPHGMVPTGMAPIMRGRNRLAMRFLCSHRNNFSANGSPILIVSQLMSIMQRDETREWTILRAISDG